jgi:formylglycine-generating enzyme required for sulfatase activity
MAVCRSCGSQWDARQTAPVGSLPPNKFGLYDMVGNVWEWTEDCDHPNYNGAPTDGSAWLADNGGNCTKRVVRGGAYFNSPPFLTSGSRDISSSNNGGDNVGFRVARTLTAP